MATGQAIVRDTAINVMAIGISLIGGIAYQSILAWQLGPIGRGEYGVWIAAASIAAVLFTLGTDRAIQIYLISNRVTVAQATCTTLFVGLVGSIAAMGILWFGFHQGWKPLAIVSQKNQLLALFIVPAIAAPLAIQLLLAGLGHFVALAVFNMFKALLQVGLGAVLFLALAWDVEAAYLTFVLSSFITLWVYLLFLHRQYRLENTFMPAKMAAEVVGYSLRYLPARLGNVLNTNLVLLMLVFIASKHEVGLFAVAIILMGQSLIISNALDRAIQPHISPTSANCADIITQCCRASTLLYGVLLIILLLLAELAVPVLFSNNFRDSIPLLWLLAPGAWFKAASKPLRPYFIGTNRPGIVSVSILVELVITTSLSLILYSYTGIMGAAIGVSIGEAIGVFILAAAFHSCSMRNFTETWLWGKRDTQRIREYSYALFNHNAIPTSDTSSLCTDAVDDEVKSNPFSSPRVSDSRSDSSEAPKAYKLLPLRRAQ